MIPTALGKQVNLLLVEHFGSIVDVGFTAQMEQDLDRIEDDKIDWRGVLKQFYVPFGETLKRAEENMNKVVIVSDQLCPTCGKRMLIRQSRFGQFLGCEAYPECETKVALTRDGLPVPEDRPSEEICKPCASPMLIRYGRYGDYLACSAEACFREAAYPEDNWCQMSPCGMWRRDRREKIETWKVLLRMQQLFSK